MADRVGIIQGGRIRMVEETRSLMKRLGRTEAHITLATPLAVVPEALADYNLTLANDGQELLYRGGDGSGGGKAKVAQLTKDLVAQCIDYTAIDIRESSLEDIFVDLLEGAAA
jgi:ABC-2 type transport system ATP-binding protein